MSNPPNFNQLRAALGQLSLDQARQLYAELEAIVRTLERQPLPSAAVREKGREIVETARLGDRLYQLERVRCGKLGCKCAGETGELHGPYWYAYWREEGKLKSRYVGKRLRQLE